MERILHVGLGPLGLAIARDLAQRGLGRAVGAVDTSPTLAGSSLNALAASCASVEVLPSLSRFRSWKQVDAVVVATSSSLGACADTFRALLERGLTVVSTCEELVWPRLRHPLLAAELDALARARGGRLLGTGVNPGFLMDALPLFATQVCRRVESVHCWRIQDASTRRLPFQRKIGVGLSEEEFVARVHAGSLRHVGLGESLHLIADALGWGIDHWDEEIGPVFAKAPLQSGLGRIAKGKVAGVRQIAHGYTDHTLRVCLEFQASIGQAKPHDRVRIAGEPELDLLLRGGVHGDVATAAIALNTLRALRAAPPGLHTMASVPMAWCTPSK